MFCSCVIIKRTAMTTALHRKLSALQNLTEQRGATAGEAAAALAAIERIRSRLRQAGEALEWDAEGYVQPECQPPPEQPPEAPVRRRARRRAAHERPREQRLRMGDLVDCDMGDHPLWGRCRCGNSTFRVCPGIVGMSVALLCCTACRRSRKLMRDNFVRGRYAD
jgi:hypothetical protein